MKLICKLAEEWWLKNRDLNLEGEGTFSQQEAFEAGFRKARDLIVEDLRGGTGDARGLDELYATFGETAVQEGDK